MAEGIPTRCIPNVPYKDWARDGGLPAGDLEHQNWLYIEQFIQDMLTNCIEAGSCDPMAARASVFLGCGGFEYSVQAAFGDYVLGGTTVDLSGIHLPAAGVWDVSFNGRFLANGAGREMGNGIFQVQNSGGFTYEYGVSVASMSPGDGFTYITAAGSIDHMVPAGETGTVTVDFWGGSTDIVFMGTGEYGVLTAHRIECTEDLATSYP